MSPVAAQARGASSRVAPSTAGRDINIESSNARSGRTPSQSAVVIVSPLRDTPGNTASPWAAPMNDLGLEQSNDRFGQRSIVRIAPTPDRPSDACVGPATILA